jgi:hypothetical protein
LPADQVIRDRQFGRWLNDHASELKWKYNVPFVQPPGETTEALLTLYSSLFEDCGGIWRFSGGITAPGFEEMLTLAKESPKLPTEFARAGLTKTATNFDAASGTGTISRAMTPESLITWDLQAAGQTTRTVSVESAGSNAWSLGAAKTWVKKTVQRNLSASIQKLENGFSESLSTQNIPVGELSVTVGERGASVAWKPGILSKIKSSISQLENSLKSQSFTDSVSQLDKADYIFQASDTTAYSKFDNQWTVLRPLAADAVPDESLGFRFGQPGAENVTPSYFEILPSPAPDLPGDWMTIGPQRILKPIEAHPSDAPSLTFRDAVDGKQGILYVGGDGVIVNQNDSLFGLNGNTNPFDAEAIGKIRNLQNEMQQTQETLAHVTLASDETLVLVEPNQLTLVDSTYPQFNKWRTALDHLPENQLRFELKQDSIAWIVDLNGPVVSTAPKSVSLDAFLKANHIDPSQFPSRAPPIALEPSLLEETSLTPSVIGLDTRVQIIQIGLSPEFQNVIQNGADTIRWVGRDWRLVSNGMRPGLSAVSNGNGQGAAPTVEPSDDSRITIICPETICMFSENPTPAP